MGKGCQLHNALSEFTLIAIKHIQFLVFSITIDCRLDLLSGTKKSDGSMRYCHVRTGMIQLFVFVPQESSLLSSIGFSRNFDNSMRSLKRFTLTERLRVAGAGFDPTSSNLQGSSLGAACITLYICRQPTQSLMVLSPKKGEKCLKWGTV